jgi:RDD family
VSLFGTARRELAKGAVAAHPDLSPEQIATAIERTQELVNRETENSDTNPWSPLRLSLSTMDALFNALLIWLVIELFCVVVFGRTGALDDEGIAVVTKNGRKAGRLRLLWRAAWAWMPIWLAFGLGVVVHSPGDDHFVAAGLMVGLGMCILAVRRPERGLQDRLAGTYLVPR